MISEHIDYKQQIELLVLDEQTFVRLTLKGQIRDQLLPWRQVIVRPVQIKNERYLRFSYFTQKQDITKNYRAGEAREKLAELLALPLHTIIAPSTTATLRLQFIKKRKPTVQRTAPESTTPRPALSHDQPNNLPLPATRPA